jgi:sugar lactone lactonase YvrE
MRSAHTPAALLAMVGFVICTANARVWAGAPAAGDTVADFVLGQPDFVHSTPNTVDGFAIHEPDAIIVDESVTPHHLYVADSSNHRVLGYSNINSLTSSSGPDLVIGQPDFFSSASNNGGVSSSSLYFPHGLAVDSIGNLYVADLLNNRVLVFASPFITKARTGLAAGFAAFMVFGQGGNFTSNACNVGNTTPNAESLCKPNGVAVDASGNVFVADHDNNRILVYFIPLVTDTVADAVFGQNGSFTTDTANLGGVSANSLFHPNLLTFDTVGNLFVTDEGNCRAVRYANPLASTPPNTTANLVFGQGGSFTKQCGPSLISASSLNQPDGITFDGSGNLFISDRQDHRVLEFTPPFTVPPTASVVFGQTGSFNTANCNLAAPRLVPNANSLCLPDGVAADSNGNLWINDQSNNRVLRFTPPFPTTSPGPTANLILGQLNFTDNAPNSVDSTSYGGPGLLGGPSSPAGIALDRSMSPNRLYVADTNNNRVLGYKNLASFTSGAQADLVIGQVDFAGSAANEGPLPAANTLKLPMGLAVSVTGDLVVADSGNNRVLRFAAPFRGGIIANQPANFVFGQGGSFTSFSCGSGAKSLCTPVGIAFDGAGNLYVTDQGNNRALEFTAPFSSNPAANKIFGQSGPSGGLCNQGFTPPTPTSNTLCNPAGVALDSANRLYIADQGNHRVLEFNKPLTSQVPNNVFGQHGSYTTAVCNEFGLDANGLCNPMGVAVDASGRLYVADHDNNRVLSFKTPLTSTTADMVLGQNDHFFTQGCNLGGTAPSAQTLCGPTMVAVDASGDLFAADSGNSRALEYLQPYATPGVLSLSPTSLSFGTVRVGTKSAAKTVTLTNTGIVPVFIYNFTISGANVADFAQTNNCIGTLQPAKACTENVTFEPRVKTAETASITISDNASNAPQHISPITGTGF